MKKLVLVARVFTFGVVLVWVLCLLMAGVLLHFGFTTYLESLNINPGITLTILQAWYWVTLVVVGILVAVWGFKRVGKWESKED